MYEYMFAGLLLLFFALLFFSIWALVIVLPIVFIGWAIYKFLKERKQEKELEEKMAKKTGGNY